MDRTRADIFMIILGLALISYGLWKGYDTGKFSIWLGIGSFLFGAFLMDFIIQYRKNKIR